DGALNAFGATWSFAARNAIAGSKNWTARKIAAAKIRNRQPWRNPSRPTNSHLTPLMPAYTNFSLPNESTLGNFLNSAYFECLCLGLDREPNCRFGVGSDLGLVLQIGPAFVKRSHDRE